MSSMNLRRSSRIKAQAEECVITYVNDNRTQNVRSTRSRKSNVTINKETKSDTLNDKSSDSSLNKIKLTTEKEENINVLMDEVERELIGVEEMKSKPSELFADKDVSGERMYGFSTPVKKDAMTRKAILSRTIGSTPKKITKNPDVLPAAKVVLEKVDTKLAPLSKSAHKKITFASKYSPFRVVNRYKPESSTSDSESVSEESEYIPSDDENKDEDEENNDLDDSVVQSENSSDEGISDNCDSKNHRSLKKNTTESAEFVTKSKQINKDKITFVCKDFHLKTDDYFESRSQKVVTSNNTLGKLGKSRLTEEKLHQLLMNQDHIKDVHKKKIQTLAENCRSSFEMWDFIMREGYNILLYGLGSKRSIINDFHKDVISDYPTLIVNGFFPSLTIKDILDGILMDLLEAESSTNISDSVNLISSILHQSPKDHLYLLVHNIDGLMLRSNKSQDILSRLASIPNLHLLASIDHINAPLMWDQVKRARYNFCWWDASSFLPYEAETSYENSLLVQQTGALALSSLHNVFRSLTSNAKAIYIILVNYQLKNRNNNNFPGMAFKDLYSAAREGFLVSSDSALRAQLTEFIDHKLVRSKRQIDGAEYLVIPLNNSLLKQFLEENDN